MMMFLVVMGEVFLLMIFVGAVYGIVQFVIWLKKLEERVKMLEMKK